MSYQRGAAVRAKMKGHLLRQIDRAVLPPGTADRDGQVVASIPFEVTDPLIQESSNLSAESFNPFIFIEKIGDRLILSGQGAEGRIPVRIRKNPRIEYVVRVPGNPVLETKG